MYKKNEMLPKLI